MVDTTYLGLTPAAAGLANQLEAAIADAISFNGVPWLMVGLRRQLTRPAKRLRPALLFSAAACGPRLDVPRAVAGAAAIELMHLASLIHDDLMDDAEARGGVSAIHVSDGSGAAILSGNCLVASGGRLAARVSDTASVLWHEAYLAMCLGQATEMAGRYCADITLETYLEMIEGKTAALLSAACRLGAIVGGVAADQVDALATFGALFGMVFQLVDDVMDIVSTEQAWGKPTRRDIPNGVYTACLIEALRGRDPTLRDLLSPAMTPGQIDETHARASANGLAPALVVVRDYARRAAAALDSLPPSTTRSELASLPRRYLAATLAPGIASSAHPAGAAGPSLRIGSDGS